MTEYEKWQYKRDKRNQIIAWAISVPGVVIAVIMIWRCWNGM